MHDYVENHPKQNGTNQPIKQSTVYNQSVSQFPAEETVKNVFSTNFQDDQLESKPVIPNPMQIGLFNAGGNNSAIPMISDMPTLPEIYFQRESLVANALASNQTIGNKTSANQFRWVFC